MNSIDFSCSAEQATEACSEPMTIKDLQNAADRLSQQKIIPTPQFTIVPSTTFKRLMYLAKHYKSGTQFVKRNHFAQSKKDRYKKTFISIPMKIINSQCLESWRIKFIPSNYNHDNIILE